MQIKYINGKRLRYAISSGAMEVIRHTDHLNRINVYPVPDGDTGSNLASTMESIVRETVFDKRVDKTFESLAEVALTGARGNSGIIFAQFLNGLAKEVKSVETLSAKAFGGYAMKAAAHAYKAMLNPVEGTMLTVIKVWAEAVRDLGEGTDDFAVIFNKAQTEARKALARTPEQLAILKTSKVVDSGAKGFVHFMEGIVKLINSGDLRAVSSLASSPAIRENWVDDHALSKGMPEKRFCTEVLMRHGEPLPAEREGLLRGRLAAFGDSVIVAGGDRLTRIHLHTDRPVELFRELPGFGTVVEKKVDDMHAQYRIAHEKQARVALVTDSIADLPQTLIEACNITVVPVGIVVDGNLYLDKITLGPERFQTLVRESILFPGTFQPSPKTFQNAFTFLLSHYESVIGLFVSGALSGTVNSAREGAKMLAEADQKRVAIIDTRLNSAAQGLLVLEAAEMIRSGQRAQSVAETIRRIRSDYRIYVSGDTFQYMVRGGRVSPMKGRLANLMNLKPIVSLDREGRGVAFAKAFSRKGNKRKIHALMKAMERERGIKRYAVVHFRAPALAADYAGMLETLLGKPPEYVMEISSAVALSAGEKAVAVAAACERG